MPDARTTAALAGAERFLNAWHGGPSMSERLEAVARATPADEREDRYGDGERIARLESRVAELVGAEAAVFMPTGTAAQQIALRIWTERKGVPTPGIRLATWRSTSSGGTRPCTACGLGWSEIRTR